MTQNDQKKHIKVSRGTYTGDMYFTISILERIKAESGTLETPGGPLHGITKPSFLDVKATHWAFKEIEEASKSHSYVIDEDDNEQLSK